MPARVARTRSSDRATTQSSSGPANKIKKKSPIIHESPIVSGLNGRALTGVARTRSSDRPTTQSSSGPVNKIKKKSPIIPESPVVSGLYGRALTGVARTRLSDRATTQSSGRPANKIKTKSPLIPEISRHVRSERTYGDGLRQQTITLSSSLRGRDGTKAKRLGDLLDLPARPQARCLVGVPNAVEQLCAQQDHDQSRVSPNLLSLGRPERRRRGVNVTMLKSPDEF